MTDIRTRIAPSPTGDPHLGTAYIALFNYCFARSQGGEFILRIEDTDRARSAPESEQAILDSLRWLGLEWDAGPDVGGDAGPYRQSERLNLYADYAGQLVRDGKAFYCYRSPEELEQLRAARQKAGRHTALKPSDLQLSDAEAAKRKAAGAAPVIRMLVPEGAGQGQGPKEPGQGQGQEGPGACAIDDMLRGKVELDWSMVDAQVLLKADGAPTYHLANVVDDHLMGITHVLRGEEWLNSAPKHKLLYEYFGWQMPELCHLPLLRNPDKSKLSKRKNPTGIDYYQRMGFLPEAVLNYLGRMGWSMPDERERFTLAEMLEHFDLQRVSLGGPVFDIEKLRWLNGLWIREGFADDALAEKLQSYGDGLMQAQAPPSKAKQAPSEAKQASSSTKQSPSDAKQASSGTKQTPSDAKQALSGTKQAPPEAKHAPPDLKQLLPLMKQVLPHARTRIKTFSELAPLAAFLLPGDLPIGADDFKGAGEREQTLKTLQFTLWRLEALQPAWARDALYGGCKALAKAIGLPMKAFLAPLFIALCGSAASISLFDAMALLGRDETLSRLRRAIALIGGIADGADSRLKKEYAALGEGA